jgi:hypothetical protein
MVERQKRHELHELGLETSDLGVHLRGEPARRFDCELRPFDAQPKAVL